MTPLLGHDAQIAVLDAAIADDRLHHAWLLAGPRGIGKASFAYRFALRLLTNASSASTATLIAAGSHPDFLRLERLLNEKTGVQARSITVDQVRALRALFANAMSQGSRRVVIVDSIDDLERSAANALLKNLEEPPQGTIFFLVSHAPGRLLPTIRSRCRMLVFNRLDDAAIRTILAERAPQLDTEAQDAIIAAAGGSAGNAIAFAAHDLAALEATLRQLAQTGDPTNAQRSALAQKLALKAALARYEAFLHRAPAFIAEAARRSHGPALALAIEHWVAARQLAAIAIPQSLIPETVVFELAGHVAALGASNATT